MKPIPPHYTLTHMLLYAQPHTPNTIKQFYALRLVAEECVIREFRRGIPPIEVVP